jgi:hypothetical protein
VLEVDPTLNPLALPDNRPNKPPVWEQESIYSVPESIDDAVYQLAAVWQMADRAYGWKVYLPLVTRGY